LLTLVELGLTPSQAKIFLTFPQQEDLRVCEISKISGITRQHVYNALVGLQALGIIQKEIGATTKYSALSMEQALEILLERKTRKDREIEEGTRELLEHYRGNAPDKFQQQDVELVVISGRERLIRLIRGQHNSVQNSVRILSTVQRWIQIIEDCLESYEKALQKGVTYRVITEDPRDRVSFDNKIGVLLENPNFKLRVVRDLLPTNLALFDDREATFTLYPSRSLAESPLIWTNHKSFLSMAGDHFESFWKFADVYTP
jgi:sugar-specific transcriptional regulator TrmB